MDQEKAKRKQLRELRIGLRALRGALDTAGEYFPAGKATIFNIDAKNEPWSDEQKAEYRERIQRVEAEISQLESELSER